MSKTNESPTPKVIRVQTRTAERFFRAGRQFGRDPVEVPVAELSQQQLEAISGEPNLLVTFVAEDNEAASKAAAEAAAEKAAAEKAASKKPAAKK